jgi:hypothetical protein
VDLSQSRLRNELMSQVLHLLSSESLSLPLSINRQGTPETESYRLFEENGSSLVAEHNITTSIEPLDFVSYIFFCWKEKYVFFSRNSKYAHT